MFRFVAMFWNDSDARQRASAGNIATRAVASTPQLEPVYATAGMAVYFANGAQAASRIYPAASHAGVVLGRLFHNDLHEFPVCRDVILDDTTTQCFLQDRGQSFLRRYWGRYVAFVFDATERSAVVMPDPTAECPCYFLDCDGVTLVFSHVSDIAALNVVSFSINWRYVAASLFDPTSQLAETGLNEVSQLRAGESLQIRADGTCHRELSWDLFGLSVENPIESIDLAALEARRTIRSCVGAWASTYPHIAHMLSGGVDSSIVLSCLMQGPAQPRVSCLNVYDPRIGGDERQFARAAVDGIRTPSGERSELLEFERDVQAVRLDALSSIALTPCPGAYLSNAAYGHFYRRATGDGRAALSTGLGGDYIFYRTSSARPAVDYVHSHGLGKDLWRIVQDHTRSRTYWSVLGEALAAGLLKRDVKLPALPGERAFVSRAVVDHIQDAARGFAPAWLDSPMLCNSTRIAPSKRRHIESMYRPARKDDPSDGSDALEWFAPLLSQPIMELFARIPVYVLKAGGLERAVVRKAFARDLPRQIVERRSKCVTNNFLHDVFRHHEAFFRETLLDGILVRERLLDREALEAFFASAQDGHAEGFSTLIGSHIDMELWLRRWERATGARARVRSAPPVASALQE